MLDANGQRIRWGKPYADGDILGGREEPVDQDTHKGRVETEFWGQFSELGICHTLRHDNGTDGDT